MPKHKSLAPESFNDASLLDHVRHLPHARASYKQLVKELRLQGENRDVLEEALDRLCDKGQLVELRSGHFIAVGDNPEYLAGRLSIHRDGFGFLIPDQAVAGIQGDIFLPPPEAAKGMHGDRALVHVTHRGGEGRAEGEIVRILKRAHITVVGEFRIKKRGNFVIPSDERVQQWIEIPEGMEIPPAQPVAVDRVGTAPREFKSVEDLDGMIVNVEILEFPADGEQGVGRVVEILGHPGRLRRRCGSDDPQASPAASLSAGSVAEARAISHEIPAGEYARRRDFRSFDIVTIDGETARDFDDAVWVERLPNGNFALQVHIADVSHYVTPGSAIDTEALLRGTSVYFPDRAVPMLPIELSTDICSLRPQEDRLVLSALLEIDHNGETVGSRFLPGRDPQRRTHDVYERLSCAGRRPGNARALCQTDRSF